MTAPVLGAREQMGLWREKLADVAVRDPPAPAAPPCSAPHR